MEMLTAKAKTRFEIATLRGLESPERRLWGFWRVLYRMEGELMAKKRNRAVSQAEIDAIGERAVKRVVERIRQQQNEVLFRKLEPLLLELNPSLAKPATGQTTSGEG